MHCRHYKHLQHLLRNFGPEKDIRTLLELTRNTFIFMCPYDIFVPLPFIILQLIRIFAAHNVPNKEEINTRVSFLL